MTDDELKRLLDANAAETRRHFDLSTEAMRHEIQLVAEGVALTREALTRTTVEHAEKIERRWSS